MRASHWRPVRVSLLEILYNSPQLRRIILAKLSLWKHKGEWLLMYAARRGVTQGSNNGHGRKEITKNYFMRTGMNPIVSDWPRGVGDIIITHLTRP